jgi:hypothetical protein
MIIKDKNMKTKLLKKPNNFNKIPAWQKVYQQLKLNNIDDIVTYEVNGNLFIVVPLEKG